MTITNRIINCFAENNKKKQKMLITYFMAGDPSLTQSETVISTAIEAGADIIEIGLPFSDPLADGPVIEQAGLKALAQGVNTEKVLTLVNKLRLKYETPIVIMSYYNPIFQYGAAAFVQKAAGAGVDGLIVPDLPFGEDNDLFKSCHQEGIQLIPLVAASTSDDRLIAIGARKPAFIYCVSVNGTTGIRENVNPDMHKFLERVRQLTNSPIGVGFGIGTGEQAKEAAANCDAVIVGSALVGLVAKYAQQEEELAEKITIKVAEFKQAILQV